MRFNSKPTAFRVLQEPMVEVLGLSLEAAPEVSSELEQFLSSPEVERARRFHYPRHQQEFVMTRAWLRLLLAERLRLDPRAIVFEDTKYGKPGLSSPSGAPSLDFNLSHSGSLALFAFTDGRPVGIDVEVLREIPDAADLADRFFSPGEVAELNALSFSGGPQAFLACWTRKEAFIKALGLGLHCPLDSFDVSINADGPVELRRIDASIGTKATDWSMRSFSPLPNYIAALAVRREPAC